MEFTQEVRKATDPIYQKISKIMPEIEWSVHAPYIHKINQLKKEKNAIILAHNYQTPEIYHGISDVAADSLALAIEASKTNADIIVMAGVHFMAETSKLMSPEKKVLLPDMGAGCSLSSSVTGKDVRLLKEKYPGVPVVSYVNTSADVKAETDICCTSANAVKIVESLGVKKVIFLPDDYLAKYVASQTNVEIIAWIKKCSNVLSSRTAMELRGVPCIDLETTQAKRKSCVVSRSFGKRIENFQELKEAVANYCLNASEKIRSESLVAKAITVFIRTSPFQKNYGYYSNTKTVDFPIATNNSIETVKTAVTILESIFRNGYRYQKAGVMLTGLRNDDGKKNLFSSEKDEKIKILMQSIDKTNYRYGRSTLSLASAGVHKKWNMRRQYSSKIDTADFYCLPTIKTS